MLENKKIRTKFGWVEISKIIASWHINGGITNAYLRESDEFIEWMNKIGVSDEDITVILYYANDIEPELEDSAKNFIKKAYVDQF